MNCCCHNCGCDNCGKCGWKQQLQQRQLRQLWLQQLQTSADTATATVAMVATDMWLQQQWLQCSSNWLQCCSSHWGNMPVGGVQGPKYYFFMYTRHIPPVGRVLLQKMMSFFHVPKKVSSIQVPMCNFARSLSFLQFKQARINCQVSPIYFK